MYLLHKILVKVGLLSAHVLCQEVHIPRLITPPEKGQDLEQRVIDTYIIQCQAEAQEGKGPRGIFTTPTSLQFHALKAQVNVSDGHFSPVQVLTST